METASRRILCPDGKMLCKSISYPLPRFSACRVSVTAVPGRRTALPRPSRTHRSSSTYSISPLIRGNNLRLPKPAGCCSPDTRAFVQPSPLCAARPRVRLRKGRSRFRTGMCSFTVWTGRLPFTPFQPAFVARTGDASRTCCDLHRQCRCPLPARTDSDRNTQTGIHNRTPDTDGYTVRLDFRRTRLRLCPTLHSQTSGPGGSPRRWAGSSRKVRLETSLPRDRDDLPVTRTST